MHKINKNYLTAGIIGLSLLGSSVAFADGFSMNDSGGLTYGSKKDPYWISLGGQLKFDGVVFQGNNRSRGTEFKSNSLNMRTAAFSVDGGFGHNWSYTFSFEMDGSTSGQRKLSLEDAYVTYDFGNNFTMSFGQINPGFSLENTASGKWIPFMERSTPTQVFGPSALGLGASINTWSDCWSLNFSARVPKQGQTVSGTQGSDRWSTSARLTVLPYQQGDNRLQLGVSGHYENKAGVSFSTLPEVRARRATAIVNTGTINSKNLYTYSAEISGQSGPAYAEVEYQKVNVNRPSSQNLGRVKFDGYHAQVAYVLTGESRAYNPKNGTFNKVTPATEGGAYEVAARYSYLNLNDKDVRGGSMRNVTVGLNWYANKNVRITANYIRSMQKENSNGPKRNLNIFGARFQVVL